MLIKSVNILHPINNLRSLIPRRATISSSRESYELDAFLLARTDKRREWGISAWGTVDPNERKAVFGSADEVVEISAVWELELLSH
jgi:hypothetical protein